MARNCGDSGEAELAAATATLAASGFVFLPARETAGLLGEAAAAAWPAFAASWDDLGPDLYMADGGRYRRRRHASFRITGGEVARKAHQPHYQSRDYNPLNGGVQRWFEPVAEAVAAGPVTAAALGLCDEVFSALGPALAGAAWHVEMHQFRIEALPDTAGQPTPEGMHQDGVDWVLVMLVGRRNVEEGVTRIARAGPGGADLDRFVLAEPMDTVLLDDHRVRHGVTPITRADPARPGWRDALVVTFRRE